MSDGGVNVEISLRWAGEELILRRSGIIDEFIMRGQIEMRWFGFLVSIDTVRHTS